MRFPFAAVALSLVASLATAVPTITEDLFSRQSTVPNATLIYDNGGWIEFIRVRSNGNILLPYTNVPELWSLDPSTGQAMLLLNLTGPFTGLTGITEVLPDFFVLLSGNFSTTTGALGYGSWGVWTLDFRGDCSTKPKAKFIKQVPESQFFLGATPFDNSNILIADGSQGVLYKVSLTTGEYSIVSQDITMDKNGGLAGIHGVRYAAPFVYYSNTFSGGYFKLKLTPQGTPSGSPTQISALAAGDRLEGFAPWVDGSTYVGIQAGGIKRIEPNGNSSLFVNVDPPTDCIFGRKKSDTNVLYISTKFGTVLKTPPLKW